MTELLELPRRVEALEVAQNDTTQTLRWVVAKLGRIAAIQEEHGLRLDGIDARLERIDARLNGLDGRLETVEKKIDSLASSLPSIVADAMREALKERG